MNGPDETNNQAVDALAGTVEPAPRRIDLSTLRDVRLEMANVYRQMDAGKIATQDATRRVYVLGEIAKVITVAEIERRLADLEEKQTLPGQRTFGQPARLN